MRNTYADFGADISEVLHGAARLHVALSRMGENPVSTRGWSYNDLVEGVLNVGLHTDEAARQGRAIETMFDTLDAMQEIGVNAVDYLHIWS